MYIKFKNIMLKNIYIGAIVLLSMGIMAFTVDFDKEDKIVKSSVEEVAEYEPIVVLELFTSQGCSSCPSADVLLNKVKKQYATAVFALSYHVNYWNYIGWEDPFSKSEYAQKQRKYNVKFRNNSNYTPQLIVNGKEHFVGSSSSKMYAKIEAYKKKKSVNNIKLSNVETNNKKVTFDYTIEGNSAGKKIRTILVLDERTTQVKRGENRNRTLKNSNIVIAEKSITLEEIEGHAAISIPEIVMPNEKMQLIVLVENATNDITGAVKSDVK